MFSLITIQHLFNVLFFTMLLPCNLAKTLIKVSDTCFDKSQLNTKFELKV